MSENIHGLGAVLIRKSPDTKEIEVGIFQRAARRTFYPNLREIMGGEFQAGETPDEVLTRELNEKSRMDLITKTSFGFLDIPQERIMIRRHIFLCTFAPNAFPHLDTSKHQSFSWVSAQEVKDMIDLVPGTLEILQTVGL